METFSTSPLLCCSDGLQDAKDREAFQGRPCNRLDGRQEKAVKVCVEVGMDKVLHTCGWLSFSSQCCFGVLAGIRPHSSVSCMM